MKRLPGIDIKPLGIVAIVFALICGICPGADDSRSDSKTKDAPSFSPESIEWFERKVRPILAEQCSSCHSATTGTKKGGLSLDSRESILLGGETGTAIVPGNPDDSLLVEAIRRESYEMPPEKPLSKRHQKILEEWVRRGAPWPSNTKNPNEEGEDWLRSRQKNHWAWKPVSKSVIPVREDDSWSANVIDRFIFDRLKSEGLAPADSATNETLLRRLAFDLTGLPPSVTDSASKNLTSETEYKEYVSSLISSPQFGVHWGRHWLDLVRYAETLGHEFDYPIHHAWQYRDAVIDSFNSDVPYSQLVMEHIAGDLVVPREHPETGVNQSLALTGFWFLGDSVHAPTDIQNDWALRVDNQIDVVSKTFMGMTVACARCHDHKFDAISAADYYGLAGIAESTRRAYTITDPKDRIAHHNWTISRRRLNANQVAQKAFSKSSPPIGEARKWLTRYVDKLKTLDEKQIREELHPSSPFLILRVLLKEDSVTSFDQQLNQLRREVENSAKSFTEWESQSILFADFRDGVPEGWRINGINQKSSVVLGKNLHTEPDADWWSRSPSPQFDWFAETFQPERTNAFSSRRIGLKQAITLESPRFEFERKMVCLKMRGRDSDSALIIDNYFMNEVHNLLFGDTRKKSFKQLNEEGWVTHAGDLNKYVGETGYIALEDRAGGWFEIEQVRFADRHPPAKPSPVSVQLLGNSISNREEVLDSLAQKIAKAFDNSVSAIHDDDNLLVRHSLQAANRHGIPIVNFDPKTQELHTTALDALRILDKETPAPTILLAASEGDPRDTAIAIRGNPHQRGEYVPRSCFVSITKQLPESTSSGRLELAEALIDPENPLTARVLVNRVWHHLMGRGLVSSPDNLGVLGGRPTHPKLLDYLSTELVTHDWSVKWLIQEIVSSKTYRLSSKPSEGQLELDPDCSLWSHRPVRRLSAESIRDTILDAAGQLDRQLHGASIPVHLNNQMTGRGRPRNSGPLDGRGRRSIFVEVRRNFLDPFLLAFDFPMPSTAAGKRTQSNVPAQALGLLNDPLVAELSQRWVDSTNHIHEADSRIRAMFQSAYSRKPTRDELESCLQFIAQSGPESWLELAHVLINSKEFTFLR